MGTTFEYPYLLLSAAAGCGTLSPLSPWLPMPVDGAGRRVALLSFPFVSFAIVATVEGTFALAIFLSLATFKRKAVYTTTSVACGWAGAVW